MSRVVSTPPSGHHCNIGWGKAPLSDDHPARRQGHTRHYVMTDAAWDPPGTVRACEECGRTWVAHRPYENVFVNEWRPEGRIKRWLRERRNA